MLNPFPIQFLALLAYLILRVFVGGILVYLGITHLSRRHDLKHAISLPLFPYGLASVWYLATLELLAGVMFIVGFYTQIAAIISFFIALEMLVLYSRFRSPLIPSKLFYVLLLGASISLFITGAGALAFDLPI